MDKITTKVIPARSKFSRDVVEFESHAGFCVLITGTGAELAKAVEHEWADGMLVEAFYNFPQQRVAYLEMISVRLDQHRNKGHGGQLLVAALRWSDQARIPLMGLHASPIVNLTREYEPALTRLERWYARHGFVELDRLGGDIMGARQSISMVRPHPDPGIR